MQPNSSTNNFFGIKVSKTGINVNQASDKQLVYKDDFSTKTYYDQTEPRMLEGLLPDGSYGMWVSAPGVDVTTANPASKAQLIFNSNQQTFKVVQSGSYTIPSFSLGNSATGENGFVVAHNLGYVPIFFAYAQTQVGVFNGSSFVQIISYVPLPLNTPYATNTGTALLSTWVVYAAADSSNLYITQVTGTSGNGAGIVAALPVIYYIVQPTF